MSDVKPVTMDSLLDMTLDDLADMPEFSVPPAGAYMATILGIEKKEINEHPSWEVKFRIDEVVELSDPTATPPAPKAETSTAFMMDNEMGQGSFKEFMKPLAAHLGTTSISAVVEGAKGLQIVLVTTVRQNKDKTASYLGIKAVSIP